MTAGAATGPDGERGNEQAPLDDVGQRLPDPVSVELVVGAVLLVLAVLGTVGLARWRDSDPAAPVAASTAESETSTEGAVDRSVQLLEAARRYAEEHADREAVTTAYAAARRAVSSELQVGSDGTHWEFYDRVRERGSTELDDRFQRVTESYEATQYGGVIPAGDRLRALLDDAGFVVERTDDEK